MNEPGIPQTWVSEPGLFRLLHGVCSVDPYIQSGTHDYRDADHHDLSIMEFPLTVLAWLCHAGVSLGKITGQL